MILYRHIIYISHFILDFVYADVMAIHVMK